VFFSSYEKPLDAKRRLLVPQDFRNSALKGVEGIEGFDGLYCFAALDAPSLECGGAAFFATYRDVINEYPKLSPTRKAFEHRFYAAMQRLNFDSAGRITLPESLCQRFGLKDTVLLTGLGESFQIWAPEAYDAYLKAQDQLVAEAMQKREDLF
jgi:MraZ protein